MADSPADSAQDSAERTPAPTGQRQRAAIDDLLVIILLFFFYIAIKEVQFTTTL